jgi:serine/threonine protein kinase
VVYERLIREGQAMARARHPGVLEIVDAGVYNDAPYLVFELLEGRTLGGLLAARGRLAWEEVAFIGAKIAEVVGHCHAQGVVHRDLKPDNLFALSTGTWDVKLFDFGIARLGVLATDELQAKLTQEGSILGTPEYMAPEALQMDGAQDHRVDIYSLGVVLFELLTGAVPFEGRYADVLVRLSTQKLPELAKLRPDSPATLNAVVERCLAREPAARFTHMSEVVRALNAALGQAPRVQLNAPTTAADAPEAASKRMHGDNSAALKPAPAPTGKRRFPRAPYTTPAQLKLGTGEIVPGRVEEISEGGVQFIAARGIAVGERGEFSFAEPITGKVLRCLGVSRWTKTGRGDRHATGFEFENAPADSRVTIRKYVELMGGS